MLSMQHVLVARLQNAGFDDTTYMAALVLPDAIRKYSKARQFSHFEKGSGGVEDSSYWSFPTYMKGLTAEAVENHLKVFAHLSESITPAVIGEDTDLEAFYSHNTHLPDKMFHGIEDHLKQDIVFDDFVRSNIDCSGKYNDEFYFKGQKMDGKELRKLIMDIEQHGMYVLAHEVYKNFGEVANQQWFEEKVKPIFKKEYPADLADTTFSYMKLYPEIDKLITDKDWSFLDKGPLPYESYKELYKDVIYFMNEGLALGDMSKVPSDYRGLPDL